MNMYPHQHNIAIVPGADTHPRTLQCNHAMRHSDCGNKTTDKECPCGFVCDVSKTTYSSSASSHDNAVALWWKKTEPLHMVLDTSKLVAHSRTSPSGDGDFNRDGLEPVHNKISSTPRRGGENIGTLSCVIRTAAAVRQ